jgi:hypothetical protein
MTSLPRFPGRALAYAALALLLLGELLRWGRDAEWGWRLRRRLAHYRTSRHAWYLAERGREVWVWECYFCRAHRHLPSGALPEDGA